MIWRAESSEATWCRTDRAGPVRAAVRGPWAGGFAGSPQPPLPWLCHGTGWLRHWADCARTPIQVTLGGPWWARVALVSSGAIPATRTGQRVPACTSLPAPPSSPRTASAIGAAPSQPVRPSGGRTAGNHIGVSWAVISHLLACACSAPRRLGRGFQVRGCIQHRGKFPFPHQDFNGEVAPMWLLRPSTAATPGPQPRVSSE